MNEQEGELELSSLRISKRICRDVVHIVCIQKVSMFSSSYSIRRELSLALEREKSVEQSKAQLELDWQQRVEEVERQQSHKDQELIRQLSRARDEVCGYGQSVCPY